METSRQHPEDGAMGPTITQVQKYWAGFNLAYDPTLPDYNGREQNHINGHGGWVGGNNRPFTFYSCLSSDVNCTVDSFGCPSSGFQADRERFYSGGNFWYLNSLDGVGAVGHPLEPNTMGYNIYSNDTRDTSLGA